MCVCKPNDLNEVYEIYCWNITRTNWSEGTIIVTNINVIEVFVVVVVVVVDLGVKSLSAGIISSTSFIKGVWNKNDIDDVDSEDDGEDDNDGGNQGFRKSLHGLKDPLIYVVLEIRPFR